MTNIKQSRKKIATLLGVLKSDDGVDWLYRMSQPVHLLDPNTGLPRGAWRDGTHESNYVVFQVRAIVGVKHVTGFLSDEGGSVQNWAPAIGPRLGDNVISALTKMGFQLDKPLNHADCLGTKTAPGAIRPIRRVRAFSKAQGRAWR